MVNYYWVRIADSGLLVVSGKKYARDDTVLHWGPIGHRRPEPEEDIRMGILSRGRLFQTLARLARRPLQRGAEFAHLRAVRRIRAMPIRRLEQLMQAAHRVWSRVNQIVFFSNVKRASTGFRNLIFTESTFRGPICGSRLFKDRCMRGLRLLISFWRRKRIGVGIKVHFITTCRAASIHSTSDSTTRRDYRDGESFI